MGTDVAYVCLSGWGTTEEWWQPLLEEMNCPESIVVTWNDVSTMNGFYKKAASCLAEIATPIVLVGWSLGSIVAMELAVNMAEKIEKIIVVGGTTRFVDEEGKSGCHPRVLERMKRQVKQKPLEVLTSFYERVVDKEIPNEWYPSETVNLVNGLDFLQEKDVREEYKKIEIPLLWIHGERDVICPVAHVKEMPFRKNVQFYLIEEGTHGIIVTHAKECGNRMRDFVEKVISL